MRLLIAVCIIFIALCGCSTSKNTSHRPNDPSFPKSHIGVWAGDLDIYNNDSLSQSLTMTLTIFPDSLDHYQWHIKYDTQATRAYQLKVVNLNRGIFQIDENNGIILPALLNNQQLNSYFTVSNSTLLINTDFSQKDVITYTVFIYGKEPGSFTGQENKQVDSIATYPFLGYQKATLFRQSK